MKLFEYPVDKVLLSTPKYSANQCHRAIYRHFLFLPYSLTQLKI